MLPLPLCYPESGAANRGISGLEIFPLRSK